MEKVKKLVVDLIKSEVQNLPSKVVESDSLLKKIPFDLVAKMGLMSEGEYAQIAPYIAEFGLDDPKRFIKWLIDLHFAAIESINDGIAEVRNDLLTNDIQDIIAIKDNMSELTAGDNIRHWAMQYVGDVNKAMRRLEGKIKNYIAEIKRIDNLPAYKFFLQASFNKSKVYANVRRTQSALQAYFEALDIYAILANERNTNKELLEEREKFIDGLNSALLYSYDKDKSSFWDKKAWEKRIEDAKSISDKLNNYLIAMQEKEVDLENQVNYNS